MTLMRSLWFSVLVFTVNGCTARADTSLCAAAGESLSKIAILEVKSPNDPKAGAALVETLRTELAAECKAKGFEASAKEPLECYVKNNKTIGYRLFKVCASEPGQTLV